MNNPLQKLHTAASHIRLSSAEKRTMHAAIRARMRASFAAPRQTLGYFLFMPQFALPVAALLVMVLGGTTTFAANGALPGEPLYALKTKVNEPLQGALAFSVEDKIKFHTAVAQQRVEEAEVLVSEDRLGSEASQQLEQSIDAHMAKRDSLAQELETKNPESAGSALARIDSSIDAHSDVLEALGRSNKSEDVRARSGAIAMRARSSSRFGAQSAQPTLAMAKMAAPAPEAPAATTMMMSVESADMAAPTTTSDLSRERGSEKSGQARFERRGSSKEVSRSPKAEQAFVLGKKATTSLEALKVQVGTLASSTLDAQEGTLLDERIAEIEWLVSAGKDALVAEDYEIAREHFNSALDLTIKLSTFVAASKKFNHGILGSLLDREGRHGGDGEED